MYDLELDRMQGLIVRGYGNLPSAHFMVLRFGDVVAARDWIADLTERVTLGSMRPDRESMNVAFTHAGLAHLGMSADALASFSPEFREGMITPHRSRILGDHDESDPSRWRWGGDADRPVHGIIMLYAVDDVVLAEHVARERASLAAADIAIEADLDTFACRDFREHFGFRDGVAQPIIAGLGRTGPEANTVTAGEFVLGYPNQYQRIPGSPSVHAGTDRDGVLPASRADSLPADRRDFGRNGTYMVFRQLSQDVQAFWHFVFGMSEGSDDDERLGQCVALAAKMVGRWPNGAPLVLAPEHEDPDQAEADGFGYHDADRFGYRCPVGAHIRRANPRDSLEPDPQTSATVSNRHRLLRRGRTYGQPVAESMEARDVLAAHDREGERGLHFVCLNTDIARQFEFVQHTWVNNPKFEGMYNDVDAITGDHDKKNAGYFTIPAEPFRRRVHDVPRFVQVRGGAYFFMPGLEALRYLATLAETATLTEAS
jgi:Dyp-type peroxidase family